MKKIILNDHYELGAGIGSWAKSKESHSVKHGDVRYIGKILMYAYSVYPTPWYSVYDSEVNWTPVDDKSNTYPDLYRWLKEVN